MPSSETDPKPTQNPSEKDAEDPKEEEKNVDRDGHERQPNQHSTDKK